MKKLGFGMMRLPLLNEEDKKSIDKKTVCQMVDTFMERGFTYFDTAYMYHEYESERAVKDVLVTRKDRDSYTLASKLPVMQLKEKEDMERIFNEQREKCGVEYFDYYLLHALDAEHYKTVKRLDCFGFAMQKKAEGKVKHVGFSLSRQCRGARSDPYRASGSRIRTAAAELSGLGGCKGAVPQVL